MTCSFLSSFVWNASAASSVSSNLTKLAPSQQVVVPSEKLFKQYNAPEAGKALNHALPGSLEKDYAAPLLEVVQKISPNNFLLGQENLSKKMLSALEKILPKPPEIFSKLTPQMSSMDMLIQIAKNMSQEKSFQASGMSPIEDSNSGLAAYAPALEAIRKAEKKEGAKINLTEASRAEAANNLKK